MTRTPEQVLAAMAAAAELTPYDPDSTWRDVLFDGSTLARPGEPDRVLLSALAQEYAELDAHGAQVTDRIHQDWLERILAIPRLPVVPDQVVAHVTIDPKLAPAVLPVGTLLRGGKDVAGRERRYATVDVLTAHGAALAGLRSLVPGGTAPGLPGAAASAPDFPLDPPLGPDAPHRLRLWSPALAFDGGTQTVQVLFDGAIGVAGLSGVGWCWSRADGTLADATTAVVSGDTVTIVLTGSCGAEAGAVPWLEAVVPASVDVPEALTFTGVRIAVTDRRGVVPQAAFYNDGAVDVTKEFQPYGAVAKRGDAFYLRCDEAFGKAVASLTVDVTLMQGGGGALSSSAGGSGIPMSVMLAMNDQVTTIQHAVSSPSHDVLMAVDALRAYLHDPSVPRVVWQRRVGGGWQDLTSSSTAFTGFSGVSVGQPVASEEFAVSGQAGHYVRAFLSEGDFGWTAYQEAVADFATKAVQGPGSKPTMPKPPVPPIASAVTVSYTTLPIAATALESRSGFRVTRPPESGPFQPFRRAVDDDVDPDTGMVALGLALPVRALGSTVSVWFDVDSAAPCGATADVPARWQSWDGTSWRPLPVADGTHFLRQSGLLRFVAPQGWPDGCSGVAADSGRWIRLVTRAPAMLGVIRSVTTDAVVASFVSASPDPSTDPSYDAMLPVGTIKGTVSPVPGVKKVTNLASVRGRGPETDAAYRMRASTVSRHRNRAVAAWDYEQHVILGFPEIAAVRCLPHTRSDGSRQAGRVGVLVLPDKPDDPAPRPSVSLADRITGTLRPLMPMGAQVSVVCPLYAPVTVVATVLLRRGVAALIGLETVTRSLEALLHPGTVKPTRWGSALYASTLVAAVEAMDVVDVATSFQVRGPDGVPSELVPVDACRGLYCSSGQHVITVEEQL